MRLTKIVCFCSIVLQVPTIACVTTRAGRALGPAQRSDLDALGAKVAGKLNFSNLNPHAA